MKKLKVDKNEACLLWLSDNGYTVEKEQESLDNSAKNVKISRNCGKVTEKTVKKPHTVKVSDEKKALFETILVNLNRCELVDGENVQVLKENKLISVKIGDKVFKIDVIQTKTGGK